MTIAITSTSCNFQRTVILNEKQIIGLLTSHKEEATRLGCWESIQNFFVKLLNYFRDVPLFDKKEFLENLYDHVHTNLEISVNANSNQNEGINVKLFWCLWERLLEILPYEEKNNIILRMNTGLTSPGSQPPSLQIILNSNPLPTVEFPKRLEEIFQLCLLSAHFLKPVEVDSDYYMLKTESLDPNSPRIVFLPTPREAFYHHSHE